MERKSEASDCGIPGPGAWCSFLKNGHNQKAFDPQKSPKYMIPVPLTTLTSTTPRRKYYGNIWKGQNWLKIFLPGHPLGADFKVSLKIPLSRAHTHRLCGEVGDRGGGMRPEWALNRTSNTTPLAMRRTSSLSRLCGTEGVRGPSEGKRNELIMSNESHGRFF